MLEPSSSEITFGENHLLKIRLLIKKTEEGMFEN